MPTPTPEPERDCSPLPAEDLHLYHTEFGYSVHKGLPLAPEDLDLQIFHTSLAETSVAISQAIYECAHEVGLAFAEDAAAIVALVSRDIQGPLLLVGPSFDTALMGELERLAPEHIVAAGFDAPMLHDALADFSFEQVIVDQQAPFPPEELSNDRVWLVGDVQQVVPLAALGRQIGVGVFAAPGDLRALAPEVRQAISSASRVELLSEFDDEAVWQLEVVRRGAELPGGGLLLFERGLSDWRRSWPVDQGGGLFLFDLGLSRRLVAMYGHPSGPGLGVLGEQGPEEGLDRLRSIAEGYDADGSAVLPTFEIIATVASAGPGKDGDYSAETARDVIRPWVEFAAANDIYVVLDLQPGRTDYLSQAKIYEEFLRLPHVGLALDPEWRLKPDEVHLRQIGTVDAAEINRVVEWLAGVVREEALPQKLLILHQFRLQMITNRHLVETPAELAVVVHMDGQGPLSAKFNTWRVLTSQPDADQFYWGWKNFYDEDMPTATAEQVLGVAPTPVFVSFQ
ncbi:MAG: hypothetical protein OXF64_04090 [bacterium]|nr:hypothetical protein [bacterium]